MARSLLIVPLLLALAGTAQAQQPTADAQAADAQPDMMQMVLSKMHALNQMQMQVAELARNQGTTERVRSYGEREFRDHRFADDKVTSLADELAVGLLPLPQLPGNQQMMQMKQKAEQLGQKRGEAFDQMYLQMMVQSHEMATQTLNGALEQLQTPEVSALIEQLLPILNQHLTLAQHLNA